MAMAEATTSWPEGQVRWEPIDTRDRTAVSREVERLANVVRREDFKHFDTRIATQYEVRLKSMLELLRGFGESATKPQIA